MPGYEIKESSLTKKICPIVCLGCRSMASKETQDEMDKCMHIATIGVVLFILTFFVAEKILSAQRQNASWETVAEDVTF